LILSGSYEIQDGYPDFLSLSGAKWKSISFSLAFLML
jgi:hypothetical protein